MGNLYKRAFQKILETQGFLDQMLEKGYEQFLPKKFKMHHEIKKQLETRKKEKQQRETIGTLSHTQHTVRQHLKNELFRFRRGINSLAQLQIASIKNDSIRSFKECYDVDRLKNILKLFSLSKRTILYLSCPPSKYLFFVVKGLYDKYPKKIHFIMIQEAFPTENLLNVRPSAQILQKRFRENDVLVTNEKISQDTNTALYHMCSSLYTFQLEPNDVYSVQQFYREWN